MPIVLRPFSRTALVAALFASLTTIAADKEGGGSGSAPNPSDPAYITAKAEYLKAQAEMQKANVAAFLAQSEAALNKARAAGEWAKARFIEDLRAIVQSEYYEIMKQQRRIEALIENLRRNADLVERIRLGRTGPESFNAMISLMAGAVQFEPIREAFNRKVGPFAATDFVPNDDESGNLIPPREFPASDIRRLMLFVRQNNYSFVPLYDAHWAVMDALAAVSGSAADRVMRLEQEIQAHRAKRISEVFLLPK